MTSILNSPKTAKQAVRSRMKHSLAPSHWVLQDAKARFSELVRRVHSEGPQHVTVHGRDEVVVISKKEFNRMKGSTTGQALIDVLQSGPYKNIELENAPIQSPVREVKL